MTELEVFVLAAPGRDEAHARSFASLRASDIGDRFTVCLHPAGITKEEHWRATHERASRATTELVLVLEDDVLVNQHIVHNATTWRWPFDRGFGAGWLYNPGGYAQRDTWYGSTWEWFGTCAVLYRTERLPALIDKAWQRMLDRQIPWDCAMAWAAHAHGGRKIRVHFPSLAEHLVDLPSTMEHRPSPMRTSRGSFSEDYRRPDRHPHGIVDEFGRRVVP